MKINLNNKDAVNKEIAKAEGRATVRTVRHCDIVALLPEIEKRASILTKSEQVGLRVLIDANAQNFPNAYKYIPESTLVTIERFPSGWFVVGIERGICQRAGHEVRFLNGTDRIDPATLALRYWSI